MKTRTLLSFLSLLIIVSLISACGKKSTPTAEVETPTEPPVVLTTQAPAETVVVTPPPATEVAGAAEDPNALPPEPQPVTITAADGTELQGYYYPAAVNPAPLVVFMHWMMGDKSDWNELAVWLQNRGQVNPFPNPGDPAKFRWWDPSWFPEVPADKSYAVLVFTFRNCLPFDQQGCQSIEKTGWYQDAQAAMLKARELEGVDPNRIVAIGSSIGADGAPDACEWVNEQYPETCQGSFSLSPGNYLDIPYTVVVQKMGITEPPTSAWCLADEAEFGICEATEGADNPAYKDFMIPNGDHGNMLLSPDLDPLPMQLILDFLEETLK